MKIYIKMFKPSMIKPIIRKTLSRLAIGLAFALLWMRVTKADSLYLVFEYAFFFLGFFFFSLAWLNYLKLDGFRFPNTYSYKKERTPSKHHAKQMIDYVDTEGSTDGSPRKNEEALVILSANILSGACFILPSIICSFILM